MWVKICGITNLEDARTAVEAGADAVGFVFYDKSPRKVDIETAGNIVPQLPERLEKVGVFVDQTAEQIRETVKRAGLSAVQVHGSPTSALDLAGEAGANDRFGTTKLIVAISGDRFADGGFYISDATKKQVYGVLVDSGNATNPGGAGRMFNWEQARGMIQEISLMVPVIVAGGLNPSNVAEAVQLFQPFGVDVSSGVEARPGKKDPGKVRAFVQAARQAGKKE